jgi:hypothetical protein
MARRHRCTSGRETEDATAFILSVMQLMAAMSSSAKSSLFLFLLASTKLALAPTLMLALRLSLVEGTCLPSS